MFLICLKNTEQTAVRHTLVVLYGNQRLDWCGGRRYRKGNNLKDLVTNRYEVITLK